MSMVRFKRNGYGKVREGCLPKSLGNAVPTVSL